MLNFLRNFKRFLVKSSHNRLIEILLSKNNLLYNLHQFQNKFQQLRLAPVLKSNAYGHGLIPIAKILDSENLPFFCADSFFEALVLRREGIKIKILILGFTDLENILNNKLKNVSFTITSLKQLQQIFASLKYRQYFHLEIDTGMHRQGILPTEVLETIKLIKENQNIILEGIFSHLADADNNNNFATVKQIEIWNKLVEKFQQEIKILKFWHLSATAGFVYENTIVANVGRSGLGLYGIVPSSLNNIIVKPVLEMRSTVSSIRKIEKGESVGYNFTFTTDRPLVIATIPAGYYEGVDRRLSNKGFVKIGDKFCPIVGIVSMNMTTVDVTSVEDVREGDEVIVISGNSQDKNSIENIARICETIPYEILVHLSAHLRRVVV